MVKKYNSYIAPVRPISTDYNNTSIILLGSMNYKMKSYGPKQLLKLNCNKTFIEHQIGCIKTVFPKSDIILSIGQDADKVIKNKPDNLKIVENQLWETTNEVEYARLALNATNAKHVIIINSDVYFDTDVLNQIKGVPYSFLLYDDSGRLPENEIGLTIAEKYVTYFSYKMMSKWCHIAQLYNDDIAILSNILSDKTRKKQYLSEAFNSFVEKRPIKAERILSSKLYRIETSKDLEKIKNETKNIDS